MIICQWYFAKKKMLISYIIS